MKTEKEKIIENLGLIDLLICSSGFEDRSVQLASSLDPSKIKDSIVFHLDDTYKVSSVNLEKIHEKIPQSRLIEYPKNSSLETFDIFYNTFKEINSKNKGEMLNVVIDVTTFTREVILILIKVISLEAFVNFNSTIVYTPNESYSVDDGQFWMTKGIREIRSIIGYSGLHSPSKKLMLIVLNGFDEERTEHIIECFEPDKIVLGKPNKSGSINPSLNLISCSRYDRIKEKYKNLISQEFEFSCVDINFTIKEVKKIIDNNTDYNIVISPLNNKVSTIAVAISAIENEEVQVCYASANQYNIDTKCIASNYFLVYNFNDYLKDL
ncbi:hypothetical protein AB9T89_15935 [Flavobacterium oncorhynchi]|uniref:hypothetical protein n=1 Tax=Flavobacterium oncorhynchi TaxID=728056 RepID=UPI003519F65E